MLVFALESIQDRLKDKQILKSSSKHLDFASLLQNSVLTVSTGKFLLKYRSAWQNTVKQVTKRI